MVKTGKWSDGDRWVQETAGESDVSEEVMTRSRMWYLTKIERRKKRHKLRGESVCRIIKMNVEVTGDDKFMGSGCSKELKSSRKTEWFGISGRGWRTIDIED